MGELLEEEELAGAIVLLHRGNGLEPDQARHTVQVLLHKAHLEKTALTSGAAEPLRHVTCDAFLPLRGHEAKLISGTHYYYPRHVACEHETHAMQYQFAGV